MASLPIRRIPQKVSLAERSEAPWGRSPFVAHRPEPSIRTPFGPRPRQARLARQGRPFAVCSRCSPRTDKVFDLWTAKGVARVSPQNRSGGLMVQVAANSHVQHFDAFGGCGITPSSRSFLISPKTNSAFRGSTGVSHVSVWSSSITRI